MNFYKRQYKRQFLQSLIINVLVIEAIHAGAVHDETEGHLRARVVNKIKEMAVSSLS